MFDLTPLAQSNAWWPNLIMLAVAALLGYLLGYRTSQGLVKDLEGELTRLDTQLTACQQDLEEGVPAVNSAQVITPESEILPFMAPEPVDLITVPPPVGAVSGGVPPTGPVIHDNLKILEGIGPKIEELLNKEGIVTYRQLSEASNERLRDILRAAGKRFQMHDPGSWPRQALLAAEGHWEELRAWQDDLHKGRTT